MCPIFFGITIIIPQIIIFSILLGFGEQTTAYYRPTSMCIILLCGLGQWLFKLLKLNCIEMTRLIKSLIIFISR